MAENPLLRFEQRPPSNQTAVDIFRGRWACDLEPLLDVSGTGTAPLFSQDRRPEQAASVLGHEGRFSGFKVLELGPLEGAHTFLLERLDAASIIAFEANVEAYLKCLVVKEALGLKRSQFLLGDIVEFLAAAPHGFNLVFCSGVLYHMADPLTLIRLICDVTDRCFVWTHYYDAERHPVSFSAQPHSDTGFVATYWSHKYGDRSSQFWGGNKQTATWLERDTLLAAFRHFGLSDITVILDDRDHPNGPAVTFSARRSAERTLTFPQAPNDDEPAERAETKQLRQRVATLKAELLAARAERDVILHSATWRATLPLRRVGEAMPVPIRRAMRQMLRAGFRLVTSKRSFGN